MEEEGSQEATMENPGDAMDHDFYSSTHQNNELAELASHHCIQPVEACTLVMLANNQY